MELNIDPKDVMELAAQKVADQVLEHYDDLAATAESRIEALINSVIDDQMCSSMRDGIDEKLAQEMEKVLQQKIVPVDMWGDSTGTPTTIRDQIHKRALEYWEEKVEPDRNNTGRYRVTSYGGTPRHKLVFQDVAKAAFDEAMKANINELVKAFRDAMKKDAFKAANEQIESIINNRVIGK